MTIRQTITRLRTHTHFLQGERRYPVYNQEYSGDLRYINDLTRVLDQLEEDMRALDQVRTFLVEQENHAAQVYGGDSPQRLKIWSMVTAIEEVLRED